MTFMIGTLAVDTGAWNFFKSIVNKICKATAVYGAARAANELSRQGHNNEAAWLIKQFKK